MHVPGLPSKTVLEIVSDGAQRSVLVTRAPCYSKEGNYIRLHKISHWDFFNVNFFLLFCFPIICLCTSLYSWSWMMLKYLIKNFIGTLLPTDT